MLPLIDLCNHSFEPNCHMEISADGTLRLIADGYIPADEAITITYGALSNTSLLQDYGFIVEDNPHDRVEMLVSADQIQVCTAWPHTCFPTTFLLPLPQARHKGYFLGVPHILLCLRHSLPRPKQLNFSREDACSDAVWAEAVHHLNLLCISDLPPGHSHIHS